MQHVIKDFLSKYHLESFNTLIGNRIVLPKTKPVLDIGDNLLFFNTLEGGCSDDGYLDYQSPGRLLNNAKLKYLRRVWAQGQLEMYSPLPLDQTYKCEENLKFIKRIRGDHYVCLERLVSQENKKPLLKETRTLAYTNSLASHQYTTGVDTSDCVSLSVFTFRDLDIVIYSQLSLNPHRIHWDRDYCRNKEGYSDIIVQGPFSLQVLIRIAQNNIKHSIKRVKYRSYNYIYPNTEVEICLRKVGESHQVFMRDKCTKLVFLKADLFC